MSNSLLRVKLPYAKQMEDLTEKYNYMAKSLNQELPGEKFRLIIKESDLIESMNKLSASLNSRKILNMNLQYVNEGDDLVSKFNWAVKVINSSRG